MKPPLNVASRRQRWSYGTDIGPRTGAFGGSYRPGIERDGRSRVVEPRDVRDDPRVVDLGAELRHEHRRRPPTIGPVPVHTPSPANGCAKTGLIRGGQIATRCRARLLRSRRCGQADARQARRAAGRPSSALSSCSSSAPPGRPASCRDGPAATRRCAATAASSTAASSSSCTSRRPARAGPERPRSPRGGRAGAACDGGDRRAARVQRNRSSPGPPR